MPTGAANEKETGVTPTRAVQLLQQSKQVQIIALVIGFGSLGAAIVDQQLNMAAEGMGGEDSIGKSWRRSGSTCRLPHWSFRSGSRARIHRSGLGLRS